MSHLSGNQKRGFEKHEWGLGKRLEMGEGKKAEGLGKGEERRVNDRVDSQWGDWELLPPPFAFQILSSVSIRVLQPRSRAV